MIPDKDEKRPAQQSLQDESSQNQPVSSTKDGSNEEKEEAALEQQRKEALTERD